MAFSPNGKHILTGSHDQIVRLWELGNGKQLSSLLGHADWVSGIAFSPSGCIALTCDWQRRVYFWRIDDLEAKDPLAIYVAYYPVVAAYWQDKTHVILADTGGPRNYPYFYYLELEGMG